MSAPDAGHLLMTLEQTLGNAGFDYRGLIDELSGQMHANEERMRGIEFDLARHLRGLVLSLLSSHRKWQPVAANLPAIERLFFAFDPHAVKNANPNDFVEELRRLRCGNLAIHQQMGTLATNIATFERIAREQGSLDAFVASAAPDIIGRKLSDPTSRYKLRQVGYALAMEYLKNVGIAACKPDVHVRRILSGQRLGYFDGIPNEREAAELVQRLAGQAACNPIYLDNLLWLMCAQEYGEVCSSKPRCGICGFQSVCNFPKQGLVPGATEAT